MGASVARRRPHEPIVRRGGVGGRGGGERRSMSMTLSFEDSCFSVKC